MFNIKERTDKITHCSTGSKLRRRTGSVKVCAIPLQIDDLYYCICGWMLHHNRHTERRTALLERLRQELKGLSSHALHGLCCLIGEGGMAVRRQLNSMAYS